MSTHDCDLMSTNEQASNKVRKTDRRIQRTKKLLSNALISLILEGDYDAITIQHIADRADLSRATFYLHYADKEDLLSETLEEIYNGIVPEMGALSPENFYWNGAPPSLPAFQHVADNRDLYCVMFRTHTGWKLVDNARKYLAMRCHYSLEQTVQGRSPRRRA